MTAGEFDEQKITQLANKHLKPDEFVRYLKILLASKQPTEKADILLATGNTLFKFSHFDLALISWTSASKYYLETKDNVGVLRCYTKLGIACNCLGEFRKAIEYHVKALQISKSTVLRDDEAGCYTNLGIAYREMGDFKRAIEYHTASLEIARQIKNKDLEGKCYTNLGNTYDSLGEFRRAVECHKASLNISQMGKDVAGEIGCHANLGTTYLNLGEFQDASDCYRKALKIITGSAYGSDKYQSAEYTCYNGLGNIYYRLGNFGKATLHHEKSLNIAQAIGDKHGQSICYGNLGNDFQGLGDFVKALNFHERALQIAVKIEDSDGESKDLGNMGLAYVGLGDFKKAIECYEHSMQIAVATGNIDSERINNLNLGVAYYDQDPGRAYEYLKKSIDLSEIIGRRLVEEKHEIGFYGLATDAYHLMIPLCVELGKEEDAFHYTEQSKSKAFLDILAATDVKPSDQLAEHKSLLIDEISCLSRLREIQMHHLRNPLLPVKMGEADSIIKRITEIHKEMDNIDPDYVSMRRGRSPSLDKIKNSITSEKKEILLIEYFTTEDRVFVFAVSKKGLHIEHISLSREKLQGLMHAYRREVISSHGMGGDTWLELSKYLIEPLSDYLAQGDLIYIVPHGALHYLPFHALRLHGEPLIKNNPVCYSPAASIISYCKNKGTGRLRDCASFGIVFEEEAREVARIFNTIPYLGEAASKENVIDCANRDIVHLSCHGYFDNLDPLSSGVLLHNEELLTAREVFNTQINSELVTLSACQTGLNERKPGDELIGLTRAFLYAGSPSVVVSLWSVNGNSTQELMIEFYRILKNGEDKAIALQEAQIQIMKKDEYSHPYFWAPFVLVGDWE